ncbi:MAG: hypothetical protein GX946_08035 [Oligosphaeraceae bacterium]|nr:hypothetical protein [Oligosphaeraceae bacterium]
MKAKFYDVKNKERVETEVIEAVQLPNGGYAFKGKAKDGRILTVFCSKAAYESYKGAKAKCAPSKGCGSKKTK